MLKCNSHDNDARSDVHPASSNPGPDWHDVLARLTKIRLSFSLLQGMVGILLFEDGKLEAAFPRLPPQRREVDEHPLLVRSKHSY